MNRRRTSGGDGMGTIKIRCDFLMLTQVGVFL